MRMQVSKFNLFPFSPAKCPVFYGWAVVAAGALGILMSVPGQTIGVSVFTDSLISALDLTRNQLSVAYMLGTLGSASLLPMAGKLYDRIGSRISAPIAAIALAVVLLILSRSDALADFASRSLGLQPSTSAFMVILLCFMALRFWGQGILTLSSHNMIAKWFDRKRGLASGCTGVCVAFGFSIAPLALDFFIRNLGWRGAWTALAIGIGGVFATIALLVYRDNPEVCGLAPDGTRSGYNPASTNSGISAKQDWTRRRAVGTLTFWTFALGLSFFGLYMTGLTFHVVSVFEIAGMTRLKAVSIFLPVATIAVAVHMIAGWLSDRFALNVFLVIMLVAMIVSSTGLVFLDAGLPMLLLIAGNGVAGGLYGLLSTVSWARFFGCAHLGAIGGLNMAIAVMCSAIGPVLFSQSLAWTGTYRMAGLSCIAGAAVLIIPALRASHPESAHNKKTD